MSKSKSKRKRRLAERDAEILTIRKMLMAAGQRRLAAQASPLAKAQAFAERRRAAELAEQGALRQRAERVLKSAMSVAAREAAEAYLDGLRSGQ